MHKSLSSFPEVTEEATGLRVNPVFSVTVLFCLISSSHDPCQHSQTLCSLLLASSFPWLPAPPTQVSPEALKAPGLGEGKLWMGTAYRTSS